MARKSYYFLTKEDPGRLNAYTVDQLQKLFQAELISPTTIISAYDGSASAPLRDFIDLSRWQEKGGKSFRARWPYVKLAILLILGTFLAEVGIMASILGSVWAALEWNRTQIIKVFDAVFGYLHGPEETKNADYLATRYVGEVIHIKPGCDLLPPDQIPRKKPLTVKLTLRGAAQIDKRLFVFGHLSGESGALFNVLLTSDDRGVTWIEAAPRLKKAQLQGFSIDGLKGWVVGHRVGNARNVDPFFLTTKDGGIGWTVQSLRPFPQAGEVLDLQRKGEELHAILADPDSGAESRYKTFKSIDDGTTWLLTEFASRIKLKELKLLRGTPQIRVQQDEDSSLWLVQTAADPVAAPTSPVAEPGSRTKRGRLMAPPKEETAVWTDLAKFSFTAGDCVVVPQK